MGHPTRRSRTRAAGSRTVIVLAGGGILLALAVVLAVAPFRTDSPAPSASGNTETVVISMAGFAPGHITVRAGVPVTLVIQNPDSQFHTDGGGWHQFASDPLGIDVRIPPRSQQTVTLDPLPAGNYEFYCDVCCGGRANPSMRGVLEVRG